MRDSAEAHIADDVPTAACPDFVIVVRGNGVPRPEDVAGIIDAQEIATAIPENKVLIHSDQGSHFTSMDRASFLKHHDLEHSMSRRGNCHDNAVAESFFTLLKRERRRRRPYKTRAEARRDVFDYHRDVL